MCTRMVSCWRDLAAREVGGSKSTSSLPNGITKISDRVYKLKEPVGDVEVEIVFIHGLQRFDYHEAYWKTWISGKMDKDGKEFCWPMTWLAEDVPRARIWSLSYDSSAWRTSRIGNLIEHEYGDTLVIEMVELAKIGQHRCPIVFVCHGLGGLLVKEMVISAHNKFRTNEEYKKFLQNVRAFFFYSVPHDGSHLVDYFRKMPKNKRKMVSLLDDDGIRCLNSNFERIGREHYSNRWRYSSVGEAHRTKVPYMEMSVKVIEEASTQHKYTTFNIVQADYFGVCKPEEKTSSNYLALVDLIEDVVGDKPISQTNNEVQANLLIGHAKDALMQKTTNIYSSPT